MENQNLQLRSLEKRTKRSERLLAISFFGWLLTLGFVIVPAWLWQSQAQQPGAPTSLRVSELVVVDPKGVERVRIGGDLPDAVIDGKRIPRGQKIAGMVLYDGTGQERSGYVTFEPSGNVGLTLDTRREQVTAFIAGPNQGSFLRLWHDKDSIELRSDTQGSRLSAIVNGKISSQQPLIKKIGAEVCQIYRSARSQMTAERVMSECRNRFTEIACQSCLGK